jgi:DNA segregation ATPase FtsK/SpoIIIE, S-DNA-T family
VRGNQIKSNTIKTEPNVTEATDLKSAKAKPNAASFVNNIQFNNQRAVKIVGLFLLLLALYFLVAFTSYLFSWQDDQSYVIDANGGWANLFKTLAELKSNTAINPDIQNWAGKLSALLAHQFIYEWFGVASFIFVAIFVVVGYRLLFKVKLYSIPKTLGYGLFFLVFISL